MRPSLDATDIPLVPEAELARVMRFMIDGGRGLVLLRALSAADMRELEAAIWHSLAGDISQRRAVLVRFHCLVEVFSARRLRGLLLRHGFRLIAPALRVAAAMRLNANWGFSPHRFNLALQPLLHELDRPRSVAPLGTLKLAA